ncbi:tetratricopeptide repeat protein [Microvirga antarctica]|uniref:tetratricopeptide repeat protein n=1 Tax=Microvirga antarctica TaxID=2819233 RepID=UPI001B31112A|nr:hypothetical protein [Microvirga antarctica]
MRVATSTTAAVVAAMLLGQPVHAQVPHGPKPIIAPEYVTPPKAEVTKGVSVTKRTYSVADNEAPFFNFTKNRRLPAEDEDFVTTVLQQVPDRAEAAAIVIKGLNVTLRNGVQLAAAGRRLNQAFLIDPSLSAVYQGYAILVTFRFQDFRYADELMTLAAGLKRPEPTLNADHGRILILAGRPKDARPYLEKAVRDAPEWAVPRANLATAVYLSGDAKEACRLAEEVHGHEIELMVQDMKTLKARAQC